MTRFKLSEMNRQELDKQAQLHTFGGVNDVCVGLDCGCLTLDEGEALDKAIKQDVKKMSEEQRSFSDSIF